MPFNMLLLPFLGGYIFVRFWNYTRYHVMRSDKDRLIIRASLVGLITLVAAFAINLIGAKLFPCQPSGICITEWWTANIPFEYSGVSLTAFLLGALGWKPLNYFYPVEVQVDRVIREDADPFELLLKRAQDESIAVSITMTNEKVYIGFVAHQFNPALTTNNISITPLQSGYRNKDTKEMHLTVNYSKAILEVIDDIDLTADLLNTVMRQRAETSLPPTAPEVIEMGRQIAKLKADWDVLERTSNLFIVVIPVKQIASLNFFDSKIHSKYFLPSPTSE